ncbi:preprotein translocase subunit SecG [Candidatus Aminicenantes bacterium AC-335-B20]|nr:preprotein translocase subunit SecG [SCandidatus Aminicenantes bacterium Aminicenantia_JdfR_composite]MCP2596452.1 preprotein translocase subunit SecG [Candidatus Aminicenantes bacterium AC-335-G13]MCP2598845.1 preprotein translocase subunit SecG [Candidatus Aminicenantes bacterium AC-335-B20]MCP2606591.1 preprotein translocase subunit SecG [Candidatus Aminicenantes bacterium AC-708-I09]MCP2618964.1 preprotein translocase subunit SecG [Candidatus Aminicenantes bacterium AC-335-A11]MCP262091
MFTLLVIVHVIISIILILAVLLQSGKAADLASAFGGAGSQAVFGPRGAATLLSKITTVCAILFMITSLGLWIFSGKEGKSVVKGLETEKSKPAQTEVQKQTKPQKSAQEKTETQNQNKN